MLEHAPPSSRPISSLLDLFLLQIISILHWKNGTKARYNKMDDE